MNKVIKAIIKWFTEPYDNEMEEARAAYREEVVSRAFRIERQREKLRHKELVKKYQEKGGR